MNRCRICGAQIEDWEIVCDKCSHRDTIIDKKEHETEMGWGEL